MPSQATEDQAMGKSTTARRSKGSRAKKSTASAQKAAPKKPAPAPTPAPAQVKPSNHKETGLSEVDRKELIALLERGEPIPDKWHRRLFPYHSAADQIGKICQLQYEGKWTREQVLARTPAAPLQLVRSFCTERPFSDHWQNMLIWGDNLLALRELLADQQGPNKYGTRGKIKLIYIDPPFATRQDFMKDREKAYQDKVYGTQFIEFLRRRLILLRELLADDGSIYVHLDSKKGHYIKAAMDEVFGENNFRNEIVWIRTFNAGSSKALAKKFPANSDSLFFYVKSDTYTFNHQFEQYSEGAVRRYDKVDEEGRRFKWNPLKTVSKEKLERLLAAGEAMVTPTSKYPVYKLYYDPEKGAAVSNVWDISGIGTFSDERLSFPTQKPEALIERVIRVSSHEHDIVLDCFAGSGTTVAVAEKLGRRWIAIDCGKLSVYTTQKRLFSLRNVIGSGQKDRRSPVERTIDWGDHLKSNPSLLLITEKARKGECEVTLDLLHDLASLYKSHRLIRGDRAVSIACPKSKLLIPEEQLEEVAEGPGDWQLDLGGLEFRLSLIEEKSKAVRHKVLAAKVFSMYRAGIYDMQALRELPWEQYRPFVLKLFGVREQEHSRYGFKLDGYIGTDSVYLWDFPSNQSLTLDHGFVDELQRHLRGRSGERFYIIAPVVAMDFAEDEVVRNNTTYVFLKVPLSVLQRLLESKEPGALKQPTREEDVNEVIDAVGFDFISQPIVRLKAKREKRKGEFLNEYVLRVQEFRAQTLATDPEDFANFETFSMAMVDLDYNGEIFQLGKVFWADKLLNEAGGLEQATELAIRIPEEEFKGEKMMVILCDRYGNEKSLVFEKKDFK